MDDLPVQYSRRSINAHPAPAARFWRRRFLISWSAPPVFACLPSLRGVEVCEQELVECLDGRAQDYSRVRFAIGFRLLDHGMLHRAHLSFLQD